MYRFIMIQKFPEKKLMTADNAVFQIMRFLNEKSSDEKVTVMNCGGYHYTGEKIIGVLRHLLNEKIIKRRKNFQPFYFRKCIFC